jgi:outer membrane receptor protein involved in Fe transport
MHQTKYHVRAFLMLGAVAVATPPAAAQRADSSARRRPPADSLPASPLPTVQVTATPVATTTLRSTLPATVVGGATLRTAQGASLGETLQGTPGLRSISMTTGIGKPVIRGLHSQRVVTMADGHRVDGQQWGLDHAPGVETAAADRIEVIKGPASVLYGSEAMGGVINVIPRPLFDAGAQGAPRTERQLAASWHSNLRQPDLTLLLQGGEGRLAWRTTLTGRRSGDIRTPAGALANTGNRAGAGELTLGWAGGATAAQATLTRRDERIEILDDPVEAPGFTGFQRITTDRATVRLERAGRRAQLEARVGVERNWRREFDDVRDTAEPVLGLLGEQGTARLAATHAPWRGWRGTVGISALRGRFDKRGRETLIPSNRQEGVGVFAFEQREVGRLALSAGVRHDWQWLATDGDDVLGLAAQRRRFGATTGTLGGSWLLRDGVALAATLGRGFRAPTAQELWANGFHEGSRAFERGDPSVGVETSRNVDLALRVERATARGEVSVYRNAVAGYLYLRPSGSGGLRFDSLAVVQGDALLAGFEAAGEWRVTRRLTVQGAADYVRGTNTTTRDPLLFIPPLRATAGARLDAPRLRLPGGVVVQRPYTGATVEAHRQQRRIEARDVAPPGYALAHLAAGGVVTVGGRPAVVDLSVRNLLNAAYRDHLSRYKEFAQAMGRAVVVRVTVGW